VDAIVSFAGDPQAFVQVWTKMGGAQSERSGVNYLTLRSSRLDRKRTTDIHKRASFHLEDPSVKIDMLPAVPCVLDCA
jgi:hypothetical protein